MGDYLKLPHIKLLWMGAYWPVSAPGVGMDELTTSGRLTHRTRLFLTKKGYGTTTALEYVQEGISHFAACHRVRHPGLPVVVSGDFNSPGPELRKWASADSWVQPLEELLTDDQPFNTYWAKAIGRQDPGRVSRHVAD